jgi:hypothetical protein
MAGSGKDDEGAATVVKLRPGSLHRVPPRRKHAARLQRPQMSNRYQKSAAKRSPSIELLARSPGIELLALLLRDASPTRSDVQVDGAAAVAP